jgi:hypothetical protein
MALVSPGVQVTITDETFGSASPPGTVPLLVIATRENKTQQSGAVALGTLKENAGRLYTITSVRELLNTFGLPVFPTSNGNVIQVDETSEHGLFAAYSYLGQANRAYVVRADIDLGQLEPREEAPSGPAENGTWWFEYSASRFGVSRSNGNSIPGLAWQPVTVRIPLASQIGPGPLFAPISGFGANGEIAVVVHNDQNRYFEKISGQWYHIGSAAWKAARPVVVTGSVSSPTLNDADTLTINTQTITFVGAPTQVDLADIVSQINTAAVPGITASQGGPGGLRLVLTNATGNDINLSGSAGVLAALGLPAQTLGTKLFYGPHTAVPTNVAAGNLWIKTTEPAQGARFVLRRFNVSQNQWIQFGAPFFEDDAAADAFYGTNKTSNSLYVRFNVGGMVNDPLASHVIRRWDPNAASWTNLVYVASLQAPTSNPIEGTLWFDPRFYADFMVNDGTQWRGYRNAYPLTDPAGPIFSSAEPTEQSDGSQLEDYDLWVRTDDQARFPRIYRYLAGEWRLIDNTDQSTPLGIVFGDLRQDSGPAGPWLGMGADPLSTKTTDLLRSDWVDPVDLTQLNPQAFPPGVIALNTRAAGNIVKVYRPFYYEDQAEYTVGAFLSDAYETANPGARATALAYLASNPARWVNFSGNDLDGSPFMGRWAQRHCVVRAMQAALVGTGNGGRDAEAIRDISGVFYNLIAAPGYTELYDEMITVAEDRQGTVFVLVDPPAFLPTNGTKIAEWATNSNNAATNGRFGLVNAYPYAAIYYPWGLGTNVDGNNIMIPPSTMALRVYGFNDRVGALWTSPAGTNRGVITNASSVGFFDIEEQEYRPARMSQGLRDVLYVNKINPIISEPTRGLVVFGDKTLSPNPTGALSRVNVARLVVYLRYVLPLMLNPFLFQNNTSGTRELVRNMMQKFLSGLVTQEAITDFVVVCDESNNTPERIARQELWVDVAIVPVRSINFIYVPVRLATQLP